MGDEIKAIDFNLAYEIGGLLAKIHNISETGKCHINNNTIFNLVGYNEVISFDKFIEIGESGKINQEIFKTIRNIYFKKIEAIKFSWSKLPKYAIQGDISINNLTHNGEEVGIFDYNIAGDEVLVGDMVLEGLFTAYEMDLMDFLTDKDRPKLFESFIRGYINTRPLKKEEYDVVGDIYSISNALWFTKISYNNNSLEKLLDRGEDEKAHKLIKEMKQIISSDKNIIKEIVHSNKKNPLIPF